MLKYVYFVVVVAQGILSLAHDPDEPQNPLLRCSDVEPRDDFTKVNVKFTCFQQANYGVCNQPFMMATPEEVPEGYCQISCGRCPCKTFADKLKTTNPSFLWLISLTDLADQISRPGYSVTILAPSDAAVDKFVASMGYKDRNALEKDNAFRWKLRSILSIHFLPPTPDIKALWTSPFMYGDVKMRHADKGYLSASVGKDSIIRISGPSNSALVIGDRDFPTCKGYIQQIDSVLTV
jgi:hypothetical protein